MTKREAALGTRRRLIESALRVLQTQGMNGLALDAVARDAGVSKGGLLHHFPSKDALIEALLKELFEDFATRAQHYYEQDVSAPGRWLRAYVRATFDDEPPPLELSAMLLLALSQQDALVGLIRADFAVWEQRLLNDGVPVARAMVIRQAADAYWTDRLVGVASADPAMRQSVLDELLRLTEGASS